MTPIVASEALELYVAGFGAQGLGLVQNDDEGAINPRVTSLPRPPCYVLLSRRRSASANQSPIVGLFAP